jgi:hypothetical protein
VSSKRDVYHVFSSSTKKIYCPEKRSETKKEGIMYFGESRRSAKKSFFGIPSHEKREIEGMCKVHRIK